MMQYRCETCEMSVTGMACGKCGGVLVDDIVTLADGKIVEVAKCPNGCGKIKSPQCCGHDMKSQKVKD